MRQATRQREARLLGLGLLVLGSCASGTSPASDSSQLGNAECARVLSPRDRVTARPPAPLAPPAPPAPPESQLLVHAELSLSPLLQTLERRVPTRLADGQVRIGPGGTVSYGVERGALSLRVSRTGLVIEAPVRARAQACRGDDCYASCEPEARVVAEVPLMLQPDYRFGKTAVSLTFTRGCKVRALGGLLTLDVTPTLEAQLLPELRKVAREIDGQLPDVAAHVAAAFRELSAPQPLPLGGCLVLQPYGVKQGPFLASATVLRARFALRAHPELRSECGPPPSVLPLPPLESDAALPEEGVVQLGMVRPLASMEQAFESAAALGVSGKVLRVAHADVTESGGDIDVQLSLTGQVCGELGLTAALDYSGDGQHIRVTRPALWAGERERLTNGEVDPSELLQRLASAASVSPLLSVSAFKDAAPPLAAALSRPGLAVRATVSSARAAGATARGAQLVAWLEARGAIWLKAEGLPER